MCVDRDASVTSNPYCAGKRPRDADTIHLRLQSVVADIFEQRGCLFHRRSTWPARQAFERVEVAVQLDDRLEDRRQRLWQFGVVPDEVQHRDRVNCNRATMLIDGLSMTYGERNDWSCPHLLRMCLLSEPRQRRYPTVRLCCHAQRADRVGREPRDSLRGERECRVESR